MTRFRSDDPRDEWVGELPTLPDDPFISERHAPRRHGFLVDVMFGVFAAAALVLAAAMIADLIWTVRR